VHRDRQCLTVKLALPSDAFLITVFDNERFTHATREATKVVSVALFGVDSPGRTTPRTDSFVLIHSPTLAIQPAERRFCNTDHRAINLCRADTWASSNRMLGVFP
jgi:hypothetical protein